VETAEICINNHDVILWVGDLNYRLDPVRLANVSKTDENELKVKLQEVGMKEVDRLKFIRHLLDTSDQLNICKQENRVFGGYQEAEIQFVPSYKFDHNTNRYDSSEKARVPAWTDRILWRDNDGQVKCQYYGVHMDHMISDHKPVSAQLYVDITTKNKSKYQKVYQEEIQKLDKLENEERPSCNLGVHELDFGTMFFRDSKSLSIDVKNTGRVPIWFSISLPPLRCGMNSPDSPSPDSSRVNLPDWLKLDLDRADERIIMPGKTKTVTFTIFVNEYSVRKLNIGAEELNCILVFHMENGGDQFISINGNFKPTVYGLNLIEQSRLKNTPIASLSIKQVKALVTATSNFEKLSFIQEFTDEQIKSLVGVPKEFHKLCSRLDNVESAKINKEIFLKNPPSMDEAARVRTALDNQTMEEELPAGKLISQHGIAEQLLIFLSVLPERVIPQSYYKEIIASAGSVETAKAMMDKLPIVHKQCFLRLIRTLKILLDNQKINTLSLEFVSTLFNSLLFVPPTSMAQNHDYDWDWSKNQSKQFLLYYLEGKITLSNSIVVNTSQTSSNSASLIEFD
jgi:phosphatidylinositol-bisphosphatase